MTWDFEEAAKKSFLGGAIFCLFGIMWQVIGNPTTDTLVFALQVSAAILFIPSLLCVIAWGGMIIQKIRDVRDGKMRKVKESQSASQQQTMSVTEKYTELNSNHKNIENLKLICSKVNAIAKAVTEARCELCIKRTSCNHLSKNLYKTIELSKQLEALHTDVLSFFQLDKSAFNALSQEGKAQYGLAYDAYCDYAKESRALSGKHYSQLQTLLQATKMRMCPEARAEAEKEILGWICNLYESQIAHLERVTQHQQAVADSILTAVHYQTKLNEATSNDLASAMSQLIPYMRKTPVSEQYMRLCDEAKNLAAESIKQELVIRMQEQYLPLLSKVANCYINSNAVVKVSLEPELNKILSTIQQIIENEKNDPEELQVAELKAEVSAMQALAEMRGDVKSSMRLK